MVNRYKLLSGLILLVVVSLSNPAVADAKSIDRASAQLRALNDSGVNGEVGLRADGPLLKIHGRATGLDPNGVYISLLYDILSVATGAWACEPGFSSEDPFLGATQDAPGRLTAAEMGVDLTMGPPMPLLPWETNPYRGRSTMQGSVDVDLDRVRTISIRDTTINGGTGPEAVVACGLIVQGE